ncbi:MAG: endonuclease Q family protein [archaeon]
MDRVIADLHIHSKYARACSKQISLDNLEKYAKIKGLGLLGTGDFQHQLWRKELDSLDERNGIVYTKSGFPLIWQTEISLMYSQDGRGRRIHHVILAPSREVVSQITEFLGTKGRLDYDGRPIFGFSSIELVEAMSSISEDIEIIPAHCMTPWFGIFGSKSGFDSLKECFKEKTDKIHAVESGMSADPEMLWRFKFLEGKSIISFSDMHSFWPWRIGRESTIFKLEEGKELSYRGILSQIRQGSFLATIETEPAYGRYHWDGHRNCDFSCSPEETSKLGGICPKCKQKLTIGVDYRVRELAENPVGFMPKNAKPFYKLIPLHELISFSIKSGIASNKTWTVYNNLIEKYGNEFKVLLEVDKQELIKDGFNEKLAKLIIDNRIANLKIKPGYDGEYGQILDKEVQKSLF